MRTLFGIIGRVLAGLVLLIAVFLTASYFYSSNVPRPSGDKLDKVAFTNVNVVDAVSDRILVGQTVLVEDGVIIDIAASAEVTAPSGFEVRDMSGRYLTPGFWDMHTHFPPTSEHFAGPMMVMNGVFYMRDLSGDCAGSGCAFGRSVDEQRALDKRIADDAVLAPRFLGGHGSFIIEGPRIAYNNGIPREPSFLAPSTVVEGRALAAYFAERGVDFVKPYNSIPRAAFFGLSDEARKRGLYVGGHLPKSLTLLAALRTGMRTVEHARSLPLACSTEALNYADAFHEWASSDDETLEAPNLGELYASIVENVDDQACDELLSLWASIDSYYVPTHLTRQAEFLAHTRAFLDDPRSDYIPSIMLQASWGAGAASYEELYTEKPDLEKDYQDFHLRGVALTKRAHEAGVKLLVGTDVGDMLIYPGHSFHDEMQIFADAGLRPADILVAATLNAAALSGNEAFYGTVEVGKQGDFVFLQANPLQEIANTQTIDALYYNGRYYDEAERAAIMATVKKKARGMRQYLTFGWLIAARAVPRVILTGDGDLTPHAGHAHY